MMLWRGRKISDLTDDELMAALETAHHELMKPPAGAWMGRYPDPKIWLVWLNGALAINAEANRRDDQQGTDRLNQQALAGLLRIYEEYHGRAA